MSANLGARRVAAASAEIERFAREGRPLADHEFEQLRELLQMTHSHLGKALVKAA